MQKNAVSALLLAAASCAFGQSSDPRVVLQQKLSSEFPLTQVKADTGEVVVAGTGIALVRSGLVMYSIAAPVPALNTYKSGKISQGWSGFGRDILGTIKGGGESAITDYPHRQFRNVEELWVTGLAVQNDGVVMTFYSDVYEDTRYYGQLKFPFDKKTVPAADEVLARMAEVMQKLDTAVLGRVAGTYAQPAAAANQLQLSAEGTYLATEAGRQYSGPYMVQGDKVTLRNGDATILGTLQGDTLTELSGKRWIKSGQDAAATKPAPSGRPAGTPGLAAAAPQMAAVPPPPPPPDQPPPAPATVELGQSTDMVAAILGQPQRIAKIGTKQIYFYKDLKITFTNGKVSDVQ
jgi:hypothetical protein